MTVTEIRQILESPYDRKVWKGFLQTQFTNNKLNAEDRTISLSDKTLSKQCLSLGNYEINEYTKIGIFEVELNEKVNITRNRVALRNLIKDLTKQVSGAMVVFVQGDKWRFSYISKRKIKNKATNEIQNKETAPKRYTYLFGKGEKALTAAQRFDKLIEKQRSNLFDLLSLDDFDEAFSVEKLSKEFFGEYKEVYERFVEFITGKRYVKKGSKWTEITTHEAHFQLRNYFDNDSKLARDFVKRMMGRIVFLYFIQKKGWLAVPKDKKWGEGNPDYLFELFYKAKYKDSFYSDYLVPLFFETLNNPQVQKESNELRFPYLNGGLFDKTQDFKYDKLALPAEIFEKLFNTFNNYNFTIYEDAPDEHTVAVDPEMLGHIFENLLEDNKDKGAFYTPKDIVHYMCRESLHNYIFTYTGNEENEDFKTKLKLYNDTFDISIFEKDEIKLIDRALEDVKICDPAIGSGAFPMGLLHEIYHLKLPIEDSKGMKAKSPADLKKHIIEESIYGVDIDSGAVDIARLRFWLSLVVDEVAPQPLPNLAFKIVCANTLIPLGIDNKINIAGATEVVMEIQKVREHYFDASKEDKKDLERQFKNFQNKLFATAKEWVTTKEAVVYQKLLEFNPFEDRSCSWFDAWWMFGVRDGFNIVIGNPPYDVYEGAKKDEIALLNSIPLYDKAKGGKLNAYKLFIAKSIDLLAKNGIFCQIFQNSFLGDNSATKIRKFILEENKILKIDSFPERDDVNKRVFESAKMSVCILLCKNEKVLNQKFQLDIWSDRDTIKNSLIISYNDIQLFDNKNFVIPTLTKSELELLINIKSNTNGIFKDYLKCIEGELNMTFHNSYFTDDNVNPLIIKGAQVQRYYITKKPSQGEIKYLDIEKYLKDYGHTDKANHYKYDRIALQGITGANDKVRLVMSYLNKGNFCANSCNYIIERNNNITKINLKYILAISNSSFINWIFRKSSTNSNVNCYEIDNLPLVIVDTNTQNLFSILTEYLNYLYLSNPQIFSHTENTRLASHIEDILNMMVYELYFEEHMKKVGIDVLQFINPKPIDILKSDKEKAEVIKEFYEWYQKPDNAVRQRMLLVDTRSKDIIGLINKSL